MENHALLAHTSTRSPTFPDKFPFFVGFFRKIRKWCGKEIASFGKKKKRGYSAFVFLTSWRAEKLLFIKPARSVFTHLSEGRRLWLILAFEAAYEAAFMAGKGQHHTMANMTLLQVIHESVNFLINRIFNVEIYSRIFYISRQFYDQLIKISTKGVSNDAVKSTKIQSSVTESDSSKET